MNIHSQRTIIASGQKYLIFSTIDRNTYCTTRQSYFPYSLSAIVSFSNTVDIYRRNQVNISENFKIIDLPSNLFISAQRDDLKTQIYFFPNPCLEFEKNYE